MPYALESSKRKFTRILDSISHAPSTSLVSGNSQNGSIQEANSIPPSKRARVGAAPGEITGLASALVRNASPSTLRLTTKPGSEISLTGQTMAHTRLGDTVTPFAPSSRTDFLLRLKTFSIHAIDKWDIKPDNINEVEWAKRGWVLDAKETVRCTCCNYRFVVKYSEQEGELEDDDSLSYTQQETLRQEALAAIAAKFAPSIINGHSSTCSWRHRGCDETIYRLPVNHPKHAVPQLRARYESILQIHGKLPVLKLPDNFDIRPLFSAFEVLAYPQAQDKPCLPDPQPLTQPELEVRCLAFSLALFGWTAEMTEQPAAGMVTCQACFRRLGFWLFRKDDINGREPLECSVREEHRPYCPWLSGTTQNAGAALYKYEVEDLAAWEGLARFLDKGARRQRQADDGERDAEVPPSPASITTRPVTASELSFADATADEERLGRWQRLKQRLSLKGKKDRTVR